MTFEMLGWWQRRRLRRSCFHHDHRRGVSYIAEVAIVEGARKVYRCGRCGRVWVL